jgi:hypothetical protein
MPSPGMLRRVAIVRTDVSEELIASMIRVTRLGELGTLAVTANRCTLRWNINYIWFLTDSSRPDDGGDKFLRNIVSYKSNTVSYPRRQHSSKKLQLVYISVSVWTQIKNVNKKSTAKADCITCKAHLHYVYWVRNYTETTEERAVYGGVGLCKLVHSESRYLRFNIPIFGCA